MSEILLENKQIFIGHNSYKLSIAKKNVDSCFPEFYMAYLSDINSQYTTERKFYTVKQLQKNLNDWIIQVNVYNNPETSFFEQLKQWDGVIEI